MKKLKLPVLFLCALLLFCLAGCSAHSLNAAGTVYDLCQRNLNDESFADLCDRTLAPAALDGSPRETPAWITAKLLAVPAWDRLRRSREAQERRALREHSLA